MCKCLYLLNYTKIISELDSLNLLSIAYTQTHISIDLFATLDTQCYDILPLQCYITFCKYSSITYLILTYQDAWTIRGQA